MKEANQKAADQVRAIANAFRNSDAEALDRIKTEAGKPSDNPEERLRLVSLEYEVEAR